MVAVREPDTRRGAERWESLLNDSEPFYGPCLGELGHELMAVGVLRRQARGYKSLTVCSRPSREALYQQFPVPVSFVGHDIICQGNCEFPAHATVRGQDVQRWVPRGVKPKPQIGIHSGEGQRLINTAADYVHYGRKAAEFEGALVIHARSRPHARERNWGQRKWHRLARRVLRKGLVKRLVCVGTQEAAFAVEGAFDARGLGLQAQMDILASARLCIGVSSGPMHLAQHCGCPIVVWCGGGPGERQQTQSRYQKHWNPFGTPCDAFQYASWQPALETIWERLVNAAKALERNS